MQSFNPLSPISLFGAGEKQIFLSTRLDALVLCRGGEYESASALDTISEFDRPYRHCTLELREFAASPGVLAMGTSSLSDDRLMLLLRERIRSGDVVGVRRKGRAADDKDDEVVTARRLARSIEAAAPKGLTNAGRRYKLVVGIDLAKTAERDSYQVVGHAEARSILGAIAKDAAGTGKVKDLLPEAMDRLSRDWRPPFQPNGLVLLRRMVALMPVARPEPPITPSALRKLRDEGWIEIAFVDAGGEPVADVDFNLRLADGQSQSGKTNKSGSARIEGITPGECRVGFPRIDGPVIHV